MSGKAEPGVEGADDAPRAVVAAVSVTPVAASSMSVVTATAAENGADVDKAAAQKKMAKAVAVEADANGATSSSTSGLPDAARAPVAPKPVVKKRKRSREEAKRRHRAVERRRVAKINACVESIKAELEKTGLVVRKDKASILNSVLNFLREYNDNKADEAEASGGGGGEGVVFPVVEAINGVVDAVPGKKSDLKGAQARQNGDAPEATTSTSVEKK